MIVPWEKLINLPVQTKSGQSIGLLTGFDIDGQSHEIKTYRVRNKSLIKGLLQNELMISKEQVISLDNERMIVHDAVLEQRAGARGKIPQVAPSNKLSAPGRIQSSQE